MGIAEPVQRITAERIRDALAAEGVDFPHARRRSSAPGAVDAAVVLPVVLAPEPRVLAILRSPSLREHGGEVGFPGGKPEPGDRDLWATGAREMEEEIGLRGADVEPLGTLLPAVVISGRYRIHPFVAAVREGAEARTGSAEITRIVDAPLVPFLTGAQPIRGVMVSIGEAEIVLPHFELHDCVLYGASAFIFYELLIRLAASLGSALPAPQIQETPPWGMRYSAP